MSRSQHRAEGRQSQQHPGGPRLSYRAHVTVVGLDPRAEAILRGIPQPEQVQTVQLGATTAQDVAASDMVVFFAADAAAVTEDPLVAVATDLRRRGLLVSGVVTGAIAAADGTEEERGGLAALRAAVDMLVVVRDEAIMADLLEVLRGGRQPAPTEA